MTRRWFQLAMSVQHYRISLGSALNRAVFADSAEERVIAAESIPQWQGAYLESLAAMRDAAIAEIEATYDWESGLTRDLAAEAEGANPEIVEGKAAGYVSESWRSGV